MMKIEIFVQARMGSTRLPGKVLKHVLGKPLLFYLVERLQRVSEADGLTILTTTLPEDDLIVDFCQKQHVKCFRGSSEDVLDRYYQAALLQRPDAVVRITADCPLADPGIVNQLIKMYREEFPRWDYLSNGFGGQTYPRGFDTEIFSFEGLEKAFINGLKPYEREHVTPYFYLHPEIFSMQGIASPIDYSQYRLTVDTPEDFTLIELILEKLYPSSPFFTLRDVIELLERNPSWKQINALVKQKTIN